MDMHPPTDTEMLDGLPHILLTGDDIWNPACVDDEFTINALLLDTPANGCCRPRSLSQ